MQEQEQLTLEIDKFEAKIKKARWGKVRVALVAFIFFAIIVGVERGTKWKVLEIFEVIGYITYFVYVVCWVVEKCYELCDYDYLLGTVLAAAMSLLAISSSVVIALILVEGIVLIPFFTCALFIYDIYIIINLPANKGELYKLKEQPELLQKTSYMQEQEKLYTDIRILKKKISESEVTLNIVVARLIITILFSWGVQVVTILDGYDSVFLRRPFTFILTACFIHSVACYVTLPLFLFIEEKEKTIGGAMLVFFASVAVLFSFMGIESIMVATVLFMFVGTAYFVKDFIQVPLYQANKKKLIKMQQQYAQNATAQPNNFYRHNYKCKKLGIVPKSEQLYFDVLELQRKIEKGKAGFVSAVVVRPILAVLYFLYLMFTGVWATKFLHGFAIFIMAFCLIYYVSIVTELFYKVYQNYKGVVIGLLGVMLTLPLTLAPMGVIIEIFLNFAGRDWPVTAIAIGLPLVFYDIYQILSRPVYKKKLTAMKEQYAQSMLNIEYE